ncbi:hypothetical protein EJ110_NYTH20707 [Nymphaea thermarum]|nr:hypothetical protein EJ110_NYTH20707 [Nymphaea thermarum]
MTQFVLILLVNYMFFAFCLFQQRTLVGQWRSQRGAGVGACPRQPKIAYSGDRNQIAVTKTTAIGVRWGAPASQPANFSRLDAIEHHGYCENIKKGPNKQISQSKQNVRWGVLEWMTKYHMLKASTAMAASCKYPVRRTSIIMYQISRHNMTAEAKERRTNAQMSLKAIMLNPVHPSLHQPKTYTSWATTMNQALMSSATAAPAKSQPKTHRNSQTRNT